MAYSNNCFERFGQDCPIFAGYSDPARLKDGQPLGIPGVSEAVTVLRTALPYLAGDANCYSSLQSLCLNGNRFRVYATWETPDGATALGTAIPRTSDSGEFWFFAPSNIEIVVKVLNGCALGGHYWVYAAGLTNVRVVLQVTDTVTDHTNFYINPQGVKFQPVQDTNAFPCQ